MNTGTFTGTKVSETTYAYDSYNRQTCATVNGVVNSYQYDGNDTRIRTIKGGKTINHLYDRGYVISQTITENGATSVVNYVHGNNYISRVTVERTSYYFYNAHGDVVQTENSDGTPGNQYEYDIFGETTLCIEEQYENPIRYSGEYLDSETGNIYLRSRYYSPSTGRFTTQDTYTGKSSEPSTLNLYSYCANDPVNYTDPSGHLFEGEDYDNWVRDQHREDTSNNIWWNYLYETLSQEEIDKIIFSNSENNANEIAKEIYSIGYRYTVDAGVSYEMFYNFYSSFGELRGTNTEMEFGLISMAISDPNKYEMFGSYYLDNISSTGTIDVEKVFKDVIMSSSLGGIDEDNVLYETDNDDDPNNDIHRINGREDVKVTNLSPSNMYYSSIRKMRLNGTSIDIQDLGPNGSVKYIGLRQAIEAMASDGAKITCENGLVTITKNGYNVIKPFTINWNEIDPYDDTFYIDTTEANYGKLFYSFDKFIENILIPIKNLNENMASRVFIRSSEIDPEGLRFLYVDAVGCYIPNAISAEKARTAVAAISGSNDLSTGGISIDSMGFLSLNFTRDQSLSKFGYDILHAVFYNSGLVALSFEDHGDNRTIQGDGFGNNMSTIYINYTLPKELEVDDKMTEPNVKRTPGTTLIHEGIHAINNYKSPNITDDENEAFAVYGENIFRAELSNSFIWNYRNDGSSRIKIHVYDKESGEKIKVITGNNTYGKFAKHTIIPTPDQFVEYLLNRVQKDESGSNKIEIKGYGERVKSKK